MVARWRPMTASHIGMAHYDDRDGDDDDDDDSVEHKWVLNNHKLLSPKQTPTVCLRS